MKLDMFLAGHIIILEKEIVSFKALSLQLAVFCFHLETWSCIYM